MFRFIFMLLAARFIEWLLESRKHATATKIAKATYPGWSTTANANTITFSAIDSTPNFIRFSVAPVGWTIRNPPDYTDWHRYETEKK